MPFDAYSVEKIAHNEQLGAIARLAVLLGIPGGLAVAGWVGISLISVQTDVGKVIQRAEGVAATIIEVKQSVDKINDLITLRTPERYTKTDAAMDRLLLGQRIDGIERRLERIEGRIDGISIPDKR